MRTVHSWQRDFGVDHTGPPGFFSNKDELTTTASQTQVLKQAFDLLDLDGILCSESAPLVYFKQVDTIDQHDALRLHRKFWNHSGAPILVLIAPEVVHVYSGMARPQPPEHSSTTPACLVDTLNRVATALQGFLVSVESGAYFRQHAPSFNSDNRVDRALLENLRETREVLRSDSNGNIPIDSLDALLCRLVFTCYLFDRKVIGRSYLMELGIMGCSHLRDVLRIQPAQTAKLTLYRLFQELGDDFRGDLFSDDLSEEQENIEDSHIQTLCDFFYGTHVRTGQGRFWPYDFGYIPIEAISAIYEHFLKDEDMVSGAFYTPRLLAEVVLDTALEGIGPLIGKTYLDPACGSGIFLVGLFNRLATEWERVNPEADNDTRSEELMVLLQESVFGVDKSSTACRIAAFSLYLAYLDQLEPRDIRELQRRGNVLPTLLMDCNGGLEPDAGGNIKCGDFFCDFPQVPRTADVVVGNPPWGSAVAKGTAAEEWCTENGKTIPDKQIAAAFVWKAASHVKDTGRVCFVLPHGILFNHGGSAVRFQKAWVSRHKIDRVLNLTDLRFLLFEEAVHPAVVVRYHEGSPDVDTDQVDYWAPKVDWATTKAEIITVAPTDRVAIGVREVLRDLDSRDAPQIWTRYSWASPRDLRLLDRLRDLPRLGDHVRRSSERELSKRWIRAEGFQPVSDNDDPERAKWLELPSDLFVNARSTGIDLVLRREDCEQLASRLIRVRHKSNTNTEIYKAPHVLVTKGFRRIAFADFDVSFRHAVRGIHGSMEDRNLLMFLASYLRTDLARYFLFHTSSNWGVYRPEVHVEEVLRLPLPVPSQLDRPVDGQRIVDEVAGIVERASDRCASGFLNREDLIERSSKEIEPLIEEYFQIQTSEKILIGDTINIVVPSANPTQARMPVPTLASITREQCVAYTERLCATLNGWTDSSEVAVRGSASVSEGLGVGAVMLERCRPEAVGDAPQIAAGMLEVIQKIRNSLAAEGGTISPLRGVGLFDGSRLFVVKSAAQVCWSQTAALNDADSLAGTLLMHVPTKAI